MFMHYYVFLSDESLLTWLPNVINCICNYTNSISTQSIITYSSLANIAPGFSMVEINLFRFMEVILIVLCIFSYLLHTWYVCNPSTIFQALYASQQLNINYCSTNSTNAHHILDALTVYNYVIYCTHRSMTLEDWLKLLVMVDWRMSRNMSRMEWMLMRSG